MVFGIGTICIKVAGRDAGKTCVIVEAAKDGVVVIEGETRRRKCNVKHLEPLGKTVEIKAGASHDVVMKALGIAPKEQKSRKAAAKPLKHTARKKKVYAAGTKHNPKHAKAKK